MSCSGGWGRRHLRQQLWWLLWVADAAAFLPLPIPRPLSPELQQRVQQRWAGFYRDFGYPLEGDGVETRQ